MTDLGRAPDEVDLAYVDVETTGLAARGGDRVCELAVLRCRAGQPVDALQRLVNPLRPVSPGALAVHGLSDDELADAPPFEAVADDLAALLEGAVVVGHNVAFDLGFLAAELARLERRLPPLYALDTLRLARRSLRLPRYGLGSVAAALGIAVNGRAHRAMTDVLLTKGVFERLWPSLQEGGAQSVRDLLVLQGRVTVRRHRRWRGEGEPKHDDPAQLVRRALAEQRLLALRYVGPDGRVSRRLVRPLRLRQGQDGTALVAHCLLRDSLRAFRLDRIAWVELVESWE